MFSAMHFNPHGRREVLEGGDRAQEGDEPDRRSAFPQRSGLSVVGKG